MVGRIETIGTCMAQGLGAPVPGRKGGLSDRAAAQRDANVLVSRKSSP